MRVEADDSGSERVLPSHIWRQELSHHRHEAQKKRNVCQSSVFFLQTKRRTENKPAAVRNFHTRAAVSPNEAPTSPHGWFGVGSPLDGLQSVRNQPPEECGSVTRSASHVKVRRAHRDKLVRHVKPLKHKVTPGEKFKLQ